LAAGSSTRSSENFTASAVSFSPFWKTMFGRSLNSQLVSSSAVQDSARLGTSFISASRATSVSNTLSTRVAGFAQETRIERGGGGAARDGEGLCRGGSGKTKDAGDAEQQDGGKQDGGFTAGLPVASDT